MELFGGACSCRNVPVYSGRRRSDIDCVVPINVALLDRINAGFNDGDPNLVSRPRHRYSPEWAAFHPFFYLRPQIYANPGGHAGFDYLKRDANVAMLTFRFCLDMQNNLAAVQECFRQCR